MGTLVAIVTAFTMMGFEYILSQRLQLVLDLTAFQAGLIVMTMAVASLVGAIGIGMILTKYGTIKLQWVTLMIAWVGIILFCGYLMAL